MTKEEFEEEFSGDAPEVWTVEAEFGHIIGHEHFLAHGGIPLEQLMVLRENVPDEPETLSQSALRHTLDGGIVACFGALGVFEAEDGQGFQCLAISRNNKRWITVDPKRAGCTGDLADIFAKSARDLLEQAKEILLLADQLDAKAGPDSLAVIQLHNAMEVVEAEDEEDPPWWADLGWDSVKEWREGHRDMEAQASRLYYRIVI